MSNEVKEITYYLPREEKRKQIAVVLVIDDNKISRGIAICSKKDQFNKKLGRSIALGRSIKALTNMKSGPHNQIIDQLNESGFDNLSSFMPELTIFEKELIKSINKRQ